MPLSSPSKTIVQVLLSVADAVAWLSNNKPTRQADFPREQFAALKRLEVLGLMSRSGSGVYQLQRQRLEKLLARTVSQASEEERVMCVAAYSAFLRPPPE